MPTHLTGIPGGATVPVATGVADGVPFRDTTTGIWYVAIGEVYVPVPPGVRARTNISAAHTLTAANLGGLLRATASLTLTLPLDATEDLDLDVETEVFVQTGPVTVAGEGAVTVANNNGPYATGTTFRVRKDAADSFVVID